MWKHLQSQGFLFGTAKSEGNPMAGRRDRALRTDENLKAQCLQERGCTNKMAFRQRWAEGQFKKWEKMHDMSSARHIPSSAVMLHPLSSVLGRLLSESSEAEETSIAGPRSGAGWGRGGASRGQNGGEARLVRVEGGQG